MSSSALAVRGIEILDGLAAEGLRHIAIDMVNFVGRPCHRCSRCINAFALSCKSVHRWYYIRFDAEFWRAGG